LDLDSCAWDVGVWQVDRLLDLHCSVEGVVWNNFDWLALRCLVQGSVT
jgi:hypothetical protein